MTPKMNIYEASNFQYIAGQRIDKVASILHCIEERADGLCDIFVGARSSASKTSKKKLAKKTKKQVIDEDLLNEPLAINKAKSQAEIDALLASFTRT
jgi:chemotaxis regulatin CheY-phosphate phosphatase CheZ